MSKEKLEIQKTLVISTAHISFETSKWLESGNGCLYQGLSIIGRETGFIIFIVEDQFKNKTDIPKELCNCVNLALSNNCTILIFDRDADEVDSLARFEW